MNENKECIIKEEDKIEQKPYEKEQIIEFVCSDNSFLKNDKCECFEGYTGKNCSECSPNYVKIANLCLLSHLQSIVLTESKSIFFEYLYLAFYLLLGFTVISLIYIKISKNQTKYEPNKTSEP